MPPSLMLDAARSLSGSTALPGDGRARGLANESESGAQIGRGRGYGSWAGSDYSPALAQGAELRRVRGALARGSTLHQALEAETEAVAPAGQGELLRRNVLAEVGGAGPRIQPLLEREDVTDVLVGAGRIWVDAGRGLEAVDAQISEAEARALAVRLAAACSRRLDDASPIVDATLADGTRLNAVLPPLAADGTLISLRTKRRRAMSVEQLRAAGTLDARSERIVRGLVDAKASCLISGATGSGKTTLLAAVLALVPHSERIVCIEEAAELQPCHPHVVHLQERGANVQGVGAVPMTQLVRTALRMRPDRIVLGECRGAEVRDVLAALNTGHEGGWGTIHANSIEDVPARLTALGALADMSEDTIAAQASSALDAVIHIRRIHLKQPDAEACTQRRVVESIGVVCRDSEGKLCCLPAYVRRGGPVSLPGAPVLDRLLSRRQGEEI